RKAEGGGAEEAGDVDGIAGTGTVAAERLAAGNGAGDDDIEHGFFGMGEVAAEERALVAAGEREESAIEAIEPAGVRPRCEGEREEAEARLATHGGDVAQAAGKGLPA